MLSRDQAINSGNFHFSSACVRTTGPRGGVAVKIHNHRRTGKTQTWVTRPNDWRIPTKHGLYDHESIYHYDAALWHTAEDCPLLTETP